LNLTYEIDIREYGQSLKFTLQGPRESKGEVYTKMCIFKRVVQIHIILHSTPERLLSRTPQGSAARTKIQLTVGFTEYHMENYYKFESVSIINNFNNLYPLLIRMLKSRIYAMHVVFVGGQIRVRHFVRKSQWKSPPKGKFTI